MSQGGNKTWLFVGLGCGVLGLLGACVGTAVLLFFVGEAQNDYADMGAYGDPGSNPFATPVGDMAAPVPAGYRPVTGPGYSFAVPGEWNELPADQTLVSIGSPTMVAGFYPNVNIVSEPFFGDLSTYTASSRLQLVGLGATVQAERPSAVGSSQAVDFDVQTPQSVALQRITLRGSTGWVMTCSGGPGTMELVRAQCLQIFETLRLQ